MTTGPRGDMDASKAPPEKTAAVAKARMRPRDAATLILVDRSSGEPRILMGRRGDTQVFMPGKYVFPGGRVDKTDRDVPLADDLRASDAERLLIDMKGWPSMGRARALALAAIRETFEEAGLLIGAPADAPGTAKDPSWQQFLNHGLVPRLGALTFFARAITPPGRPRRYDTRFFCADAAAITLKVEIADPELSGLHWLTLEEARGFDLPAITRVIIEDLSDRIRAGNLEAEDMPVPYYHHKHGSFCRELLGQSGT